jgi:AcrR family transcriptional regulator
VGEKVNAFTILGDVVGVRDERRAERDRLVLKTAGELFWSQGYAATTIPQIAARARVAVGTVAKVGSKDALFLRTWEEGSTEISLRLIADAGATSDNVTQRVWEYLSQMIEATISMPQLIRDYFVAYLRAAEHEANIARVATVLDALTELISRDRLTRESARLAAWTIWLAYSGLAYGLAANTYTPEQARDVMRAIVDAQCAPFEGKEAE